MALAQIGEDVAEPPPEHEADDRQPEPGRPGPPRRFYASVAIDPDRAGRDVGRIAEEVLQHLTTLRGAKVKITLDVDAEIPEGVPDDVQRVVTENCQTLKFTTHGFAQR